MIFALRVYLHGEVYYRCILVLNIVDPLLENVWKSTSCCVQVEERLLVQERSVAGQPPTMQIE